MPDHIAHIIKPTLIAVGVCLASAGNGPARAAGIVGGPSLQELQEAQAVIAELHTYVSQLIQAAQGGGGLPPRCEEITDPQACQQAGCVWDDGCFSPENDTLALQVLLSMQSRVFDQGKAAKDAAESFPNPIFTQHVARACQLSVEVLSLASEGQDAAAWPAVGFVTPAKFAPAFQKEQVAREKLHCP